MHMPLMGCMVNSCQGEDAGVLFQFVNISWLEVTQVICIINLDKVDIIPCLYCFSLSGQ